MRTADFDYELPPELIAQKPPSMRGASRMLVLSRPAQSIRHLSFEDFPSFLSDGDVLVLNDSRVVPARLHGVNNATGGRFELLLLEENGTNDWWVMMRPGKRAREGTSVTLLNPDGEKTAYTAQVLSSNPEGHRRVRFAGAANIIGVLDEIGEVPLPPYIVRENGVVPEDKDRYQTVFARPPGSVAAPTAGLHFTDPLLEALRVKGVRICFVTLHVGFGTFAPVKAEDIREHPMHEERYDLPESTVAAIEAARRNGRKVFAVGTTSIRVLESAAAGNGSLVPGFGKTRIFIYPPFQFKVADALLTNFHLPRSTLLMLVSAFASPGQIAGRELALRAYAEAVRERYRFFSYGDAMLIV